MSRYRKNKDNIIGQIRTRVFDRIDNTARNNRKSLMHIALIAFALFLFVSLFVGDTGFIRIAELHLKKHQLEKENHRILIELIDADLTRDRLIEDPRFLEHVARTRHFMSRPGEVIYRLR